MSQDRYLHELLKSLLGALAGGESWAQLKCREEQCMADYQGLYTYDLYLYLSKRVFWTLISAMCCPVKGVGGGTGSVAL